MSIIEFCVLRKLIRRDLMKIGDLLQVIVSLLGGI